MAWSSFRVLALRHCGSLIVICILRLRTLLGRLIGWMSLRREKDCIRQRKLNGAKEVVVSSGAKPAALCPKLKDQLIQENLSSITVQDSRLAAAVNGSGTKCPNFSIGQVTYSEVNQLGKIWVGDGAKKSDGLGFISTDGARVYRPPTHRDSSFYNDRRVGQF